MIHKLLNVTFGNAVNINNRLENFVSATPLVDLEYDTETFLLTAKTPGKNTKLVGLTNIKDMTVAELSETGGVGTRVEKKTGNKA